MLSDGIPEKNKQVQACLWAGLDNIPGKHFRPSSLSLAWIFYILSKTAHYVEIIKYFSRDRKKTHCKHLPRLSSIWLLLEKVLTNFGGNHRCCSFSAKHVYQLSLWIQHFANEHLITDCALIFLSLSYLLWFWVTVLLEFIKSQRPKWLVGGVSKATWNCTRWDNTCDWPLRGKFWWWEPLMRN